MTPQDFYNDTIGRKIDVDGMYGNQCVDLFHYFCNKTGVPYANTVTGWAGGLFTHRKEHYKKYFEVITQFNKLKTGDWIFTTNPEHVAMWYNGKMLGQNQNGKLSAVDLREFNGRFLGAYRPKYSTPTPTPTPTPTGDAIDYLAKMVIAGKFGNGADRKAGIYNYVQSAVNAFLANKPYETRIASIVKDVVAGKYGNGTNRRNAIYTVVQNRVNKLLS